MYTITKNEIGFSFSQPAFGFFTQSTATEPELSSNDMNAENEASNLMGNVSYYSSGSGCNSYAGSPSSNSLASYSNNTVKDLLQRSISSHSLYKGGSEDGIFRIVYSYDDLMENRMIIEGMKKVSRYSAEEKRERIERYRSKRNLRNFKKKIQYECRKTLADSRRRSKGRFMRNDEISTMTKVMEDRMRYDNHLLNDQCSSARCDHMMAGGDEDKEAEENSWINLLDCSFFPVVD